MRQYASADSLPLNLTANSVGIWFKPFGRTSQRHGGFSVISLAGAAPGVVVRKSCVQEPFSIATCCGETGLQTNCSNSLSGIPFFLPFFPNGWHRSGFVCCGGVAELTLDIIACRAVDSHLVAPLGDFVRHDENVKPSPKTGPRAWRLRRYQGRSQAPQRGP